MNTAHSSPVAGTNHSLEKTRSPEGAPVAGTVAANALFAQALADAAAVLLKAAHALSGEIALSLPDSQNRKEGHTSPLPPVFSDLTISDLVNQFLVAKCRAGRSDRYLRALRVSLSSFSKGRSNRSIDAVTAQEVEQWIYDLKVRPRTMHGYLSDVKTLYNFAHRRGYIGKAFCESLQSIDLPDSDTDQEAPGIHTPEEVRTVLEHLRTVDLDVMRHIAIRYFGGVRSAEAHRLREENILLDRGVIEIPAAKAKTRSRRLVTINATLAAWLALGGTLRNLCPENVRQKIRLSGVAWKPNVTRHSFVTYHYAAFEDPKKTAKEAGHSEEMLFAHYRALATKETADAFWAIFPEVLGS